MGFAVVHDDEGHRLAGDGPVVEVVNLFLAHLGARQFSPASIRGYAYDLLNFCRFLAERLLGLADVAPSGVFAWLDWYVRTCFHRQR